MTASKAKTTKPRTTKPSHLVVDNVFIAQTSQGELRIPLQFKTKLLRAIRDSGDELDQLIALLDGIGDKESIALIDELDIFETVQHVTQFFEAFQEKHDATVGEARRSSKT
jgi:hypothetical protein